jgi:prevent-host-death family protein
MKLSALLELVRAGETVTITDRGRPVARLVPAAGSESETDEERVARLERKGVIRRGKPMSEETRKLILSPPPKARASVLEALLEERREGR